jgi:tetratricopeptide (TPR) repeat protein
MPSRKATATGRNRTSHGHEAFAAAEGLYAEAMESFLRKRDWRLAASGFRAFLDKYGTERDLAEIADRARVHLTACEQKLAPEAPAPVTADEWLRHGVSLANGGQAEEALGAFDKAESLGFAVGRVHYARAAALALDGRLDDALNQLKQAIEVDPEHRAHSLGDPDFERLRETAGYVALVEPPDSDLGDDYDDLDDDDFDDDEELDGADQEVFDDGPQIVPPEEIDKGPAIY